MAYRSVETKIWQDSKIRHLNTNCKLVFIYLITNKHSHYCGLYYLPLQLIEIELGISIKDVMLAIENLILHKLIKYDNDTYIIWVVNMFNYQCKSSQTKLITGAKKYLEGIDSYIVNEFEEHYCDTLSIP